MSRRHPNAHRLVAGVWKRDKPRVGISTASGHGKSYEAKPPPEGWPGGAPEKNGWRPGRKAS